MTINSLSGFNKAPLTDKPATRAASSSPDSAIQAPSANAYAVEISSFSGVGQETSVLPEAPDKHTISSLMQNLRTNPATTFAQANSQPENVLSLLTDE
jgi:hypothetical protein